MLDILSLNELDSSMPIEKKNTVECSSYQTDFSLLSKTNIFITALNKVILKIDDTLKILNEINKDTNVRAIFYNNITFTNKILEEFYRSCSVLDITINEDAKDILSEICIHISKAKLNLAVFSIKKDAQLAYNAKNSVSIVLNYFEVIKQTLETTQKNFTTHDITNNYQEENV